MKTFNQNTSILFDTNRAVSSTEEPWGSIRENSYVCFGDDENFYTIGKIQPLFYIKDFMVKDGSLLTINGDCGINLLEGDTAQISFKEYELLTVISCLSPGKGYKIGEIISLVGGQPVIDKFTGKIQNCSFTVNRVDADGGILQVQLNNRGRYYQPPEKEADVEGSGSGAKIKAEYIVPNERNIQEKTIVKLEKKSSETIVWLDSPLPEGVKDGKLSVDKWEMYLTSNYAGETKTNVNYHVMRDFTPHLKLPLIVPGIKNPETIYNLAANIIDKAFKELLDRKS